MEKTERQLRFEAQTREQFEALGRFVQAFEHVVFAIRSGIESRLQLESRNMVFFTRMIFHHKSLTAWPLWEIFRAMIYTDVSEIRPEVPSDVEEFNYCLKRIGGELERLVEKRNNILHGTPFIGWASTEQDDFSDLDILKWGVSSRGWKQSDTPKSASDLLIIVEHCKRVERAVRILSSATAFHPVINRRHVVKQAVAALEANAESS